MYSGLLVGLGVGLVLRVGSSTGGMDIPPVILHEKMGLPLAGLMYSFDTVSYTHLSPAWGTTSKRPRTRCSV